MQIVLSPIWAARTARLIRQSSAATPNKGVFTTKFLHSIVSLDPKALWRTRNIGIIAHIDAVCQTIIYESAPKTKTLCRVKLQRLSGCSITVVIRAESAVYTSLSLSILCCSMIPVFSSQCDKTRLPFWLFVLVVRLLVSLDMASSSILIQVLRCRRWLDGDRFPASRTRTRYNNTISCYHFPLATLENRE